jgi:RNA polymerase subunit RPABC4/transcription elongation factor Spt4
MVHFHSEITMSCLLLIRILSQHIEKYSMNWSAEQLALAQKYSSPDETPADGRQYKCYTCHAIVSDPICPICGDEHLQVMCPLDHAECSHDISAGIEYCPLCGEAVCPICGSHDVVQISRVTGYLQDVTGWNAGKQQELKDRQRYTVT